MIFNPLSPPIEDTTTTERVKKPAVNAITLAMAAIADTPTAASARTAGTARKKIQVQADDKEMPPSLATPLGQGIVSIAGRYLLTDDKPGAVAYWAATHAPAVSPDRAESVIMLLQYLRWKGAQFLNEFLRAPAADAILVGIIGRLMPYCPPLSTSTSAAEAEFRRLGAMSQHNANVDLDIQSKSPQSLYDEMGEQDDESEEEERDEDESESEEERDMGQAEEHGSDIEKGAKELGVTEEYLKKLVAADQKLKLKQQETMKLQKDSATTSCKTQRTVSTTQEAGESAPSGTKMKPIPKVAPERRPATIRYQTPLDRPTEPRQRSHDHSRSHDGSHSTERHRDHRAEKHRSYSRSQERRVNITRTERRGNTGADRSSHQGRDRSQASRERDPEPKPREAERRNKRSRSRSPKSREDKRQNRRSTPPPSSSDTVSRSQFEQLTLMIRTLTNRVNRQERKR